MNYYVYYMVEPSRLDEVRSAVQSLFSALELRCGVRGRWMRRRDDPATYMEVYEDVADAASFEAALSRETAGFPLARKTEIFQCA